MRLERCRHAEQWNDAADHRGASEHSRKAQPDVSQPAHTFDWLDRLVDFFSLGHDVLLQSKISERAISPLLQARSKRKYQSACVAAERPQRPPNKWAAQGGTVSKKAWKTSENLA